MKTTKVKYSLSAILLVFLFLISCGTVKQVPVEFTCELLPAPIKSFKIDALGNIYTISRSNRLKVYDAGMNQLFEYFNNGLGEISYIDVTNSRKIILFFAGFQKMLFLDNTLSEIGRFDIDFNLPYDIRAMGSTRDNNLWIYDALDYKLKKIDNAGKIILESNPVESYLDISIAPDYIIEYNNEVLLIEENKGIAVFDNFGNYLRYIGLLEGVSISVANGSLIYMKGKVLMQMMLENKFIEPQEIKTVPTRVGTAYIFRNDLYYLEHGCLKVQALN